MSKKYYVSEEAYQRRLEEDAKDLKLNPSIYKKKFAEWDSGRFWLGSKHDHLVCVQLKQEDIPYILSYLESHSNISHLMLIHCEVNSKIMAEFVSALKVPMILRYCTISDGELSHLLKHYPLTELEMMKCVLGPTDTISLLNHSALKILDLSLCTLLGKNFLALSNSTITSLDLSSSGIDSKDVGFLSNMHALKKLSLSGNPGIGDEGAYILSSHPTVTWLTLVNCGIGPKGAEYLQKNHLLTTLNLNCTSQIENEGVTALSSHSTITELTLFMCNVGQTAADSLSKNRVLKTLNLSRNPLIKGEGVRALLLIATLTSLHLHSNNIGPAEAAYFLNCPALKDLNLSRNPLGDEGAECISRIPTLTELMLDDCKMSSKGAKYFLKTLHLESLDLKGNKIGDEGAEFLSTHPALTSLELPDCALGDRGAIALANNSHLIKLNLCNNNIVYWGAIALGLNQSIQFLGLPVEKVDLLALYSFLGNQALKCVHLGTRRDTQAKRLFDFVTSRNRSSLFQSPYPKEIKKELLNHLPPVLTEIIRSYTPDEYYSFKLFHDHEPHLGRGSSNQDQDLVLNCVKFISNNGRGNIS